MYKLLLLTLLFCSNIICNGYPNIIIFKMQNDNILKEGTNYLHGGLNAIDNINYLLEVIHVDNIITINDNYENCLLNSKKKSLNGIYGSEIHEELLFKKDPFNFYISGFPILYNNSFIKFIDNLNDTFILTGLEGEKEIDQASHFFTLLRKKVIVYLPGIVWKSENNKNNTVEKMIKRKNIIINDFDNKKNIYKQLLTI